MTLAGLMVVVWLVDPQPEPLYAGPVYFTLSYGLGAASVLALWWRRRYATALACLLILGSVFLTVLSGPSLVALFAVAGYRPFGRTLWVTALALVTAPAQILLGAPLADADFWRGVIPLSLVCLVAVGWGMALRTRRELVESLRERARQLVRERGLVADQARRSEREDIARDMHDSLAHRLSLISMSAGALDYRRGEIPEDLADLAMTLQDHSGRALDELRSVVGTLRAQENFDVPPSRELLVSDIQSLVRQGRDVGQSIDAEIDVAPGMSDRLARIVFRTTQELLTNARKHSPRSTVLLTIAGDAGAGVRVRSSNAVETGTDAPGDEGSGLLGMSERVKIHGGRLVAGRTTRQRFEVEVWLPWSES
ncbi:MAG: sensor histidine kinase [Microbacterium sp.]